MSRPVARVSISVATLTVAVAGGVVFFSGQASSSSHSDGGMQVLVHRPAGLSRATKVPLVVIMSGSDAAAFMGITRFNDQADRSGFVVANVVIPRTYNDQARLEQGRGEPYPDIVFIEKTIIDVTKTENIDPARVYFTGFSAGGALSYRTACVLAGKLAAVAPVGATNRVPGCTPARPVSMFVIYGSSDPFVTASAVEQDVAHFREFDRCPAAASTTASGGASVRTWSGCRAGTSVALAAVAAQGHAWPQSPQFDTTGSIWRFFSTHRAGGSTAGTGGNVLGVTVLSGAQGRRVRVRVKADEDLSVRLRLLKANQVLVSKTSSVKLAKIRTLYLFIPARVAAGTYELQIVMRSTAGGPGRTIVRQLRVP